MVIDFEYGISMAIVAISANSEILIIYLARNYIFLFSSLIIFGQISQALQLSQRIVMMYGGKLLEIY